MKKIKVLKITRRIPSVAEEIEETSDPLSYFRAEYNDNKRFNLNSRGMSGSIKSRFHKESSYTPRNTRRKRITNRLTEKTSEYSQMPCLTPEKTIPDRSMIDSYLSRKTKKDLSQLLTQKVYFPKTKLISRQVDCDSSVKFWHMSLREKSEKLEIHIPVGSPNRGLFACIPKRYFSNDRPSTRQ